MDSNAPALRSRPRFKQSAISKKNGGGGAGDSDLKERQHSQRIIREAAARLLATDVSSQLREGLKNSAYYPQGLELVGGYDLSVRLIGAIEDCGQARKSPLTQHRVSASQLSLADAGYRRLEAPVQIFNLELDNKTSPQPQPQTGLKQCKKVDQRSSLHDIIKKKDGQIKELREEVERLKAIVLDRDDRLEKAHRFAVLTEKTTNLRRPRTSTK